MLRAAVLCIVQCTSSMQKFEHLILKKSAPRACINLLRLLVFNTVSRFDIGVGFYFVICLFIFYLFIFFVLFCFCLFSFFFYLIFLKNSKD